MQVKSKAVILLSGGLDSATVLAIAREKKFDLYTLSFYYGQRHQIEIEAARKIAQVMNVVKHVVLDIDLQKFGGSALTDNIEVPKGRLASEMSQNIPVTYVPARNTIFLSFALAWAEVLEANHVFIGVNAIDFSGYPDCRPEYIEAYQKMANLATKRGVEGEQRLVIHTPLIDMNKADIIRKGLELGLDYSMTVSCYDPDQQGIACGKCDACLLRLNGFSEVGISDPLPYQS